MIRAVLASALCLAAGAAAAHPAMTGEPTTMRAAPSPRAHVVQEIPAHAQIDIRDCGDRWCAASWRNIDGFVRVDAIGPNDEPLAGPGGPGPYYYGGPVVVGPVFGWGWGGGYYHRHW